MWNFGRGIELVMRPDEAGRVFRLSGHPFRFQSGHYSDLTAAGVAADQVALELRQAPKNV
jgi:hypothetical protein